MLSRDENHAEAEKEDTKEIRRVATIVGILIEFLLTIQGTVSIGFYARHYSQLSLSYLPQPSVLLLGVATFFPFLYSLGYKHVFKTAGRSVNPAVVFVWAFLLNTPFLADYLIRAPSTDYVSGNSVTSLPLTGVWECFAGISMVFLVIVAILASFSLAGVKLALGLSVEGIDRKTYNIPVGQKAVFSAFMSGSSSSLYLSRFREKEQDERAIYLKRRYPIGDEIIIAFGYDMDLPEQGTILATAAYSKYSMASSHQKGLQARATR